MTSAEIEPSRLDGPTPSVRTPPAIELIRCSELAASVPYAYAAVLHDVGRLIFTAGACPLDEAGRTVAPGDVRSQAEQVMTNLRAALGAAGAGLADVVKTTVYVASADRQDLVAVWDIVSGHFGDHDVPSTLLGVTTLGYPDQLVEVEAVAAIPRPDGAGGGGSGANRRT